MNTLVIVPKITYTTGMAKRVNETNESYNARMGEWRLRNKDRIKKYNRNYHARVGYEAERQWQLRYPERFKAQLKVKYALKTGKLVKQPCIDCGNPMSVAHHPDYSKPLEVVWYCRSHHREHHYGDTRSTKKPSKGQQKNATNHHRKDSHE